jgi:hypothetical protein
LFPRAAAAVVGERGAALTPRLQTLEAEVLAEEENENGKRH